MEDFAVTEAPSMDTAVDTVDTSVDTSPEVDAGEVSTEVAETPTEVEAPEHQEPVKDFRAVDGGKLHPLAKAALEEIKAKNPALANSIKKALFAEDRLRKELPGGFNDLAQLRGKIEELGGEEGIQQVNAELNTWREFDSKYTAGDPEVLKFLTQNPEAQQAFIKIAPSVFDKFREAHLPGYQSYMTQVFSADMQENQVPLLLAQLAWVGKENPEIMDVHQKLTAYVNNISAMAKKPVEAPKIDAKAPDNRATELDQREQQLTRTEWSRESSQKHASLFNQQWKSQLGDRKLSDTQQATIKELYGLKLAAILKAKPEFNQNLERYFSAKQKDGFLKLFDSVYREAVPRALRTAIDQLGISKPGPKPGQAPAPKPPMPGVKPTGKPAESGTFVAARPSMDQVNRSVTTAEMWQKGQAFLKDGKRVWWKK